MNLRMPYLFFFCLLSLVFFHLTGCTLLHKEAVGRDRADYSSEIAKSENSQLLANIVRQRYLDTTEFLQVTSIASQKSLTGAMDAAVALFNPGIGVPGSILSPGASYSDSPTVTFTPLQGKGFVNSLLTPVSFQSIYLVLNGGWNAEMVLRLALHKIDRYYNQNVIIMSERGQYRENYRIFLRLVRAFRALQYKRAADFYFRKLIAEERKEEPKDEQKEEQLVLAFHPTEKPLPEELEIRRLLHIPSHFDHIVFTSHYHKNNPGNFVSVRIRSVNLMMAYLANSVRVPPSDRDITQQDVPSTPIMRIYSSEKPVSSTISTFYHKHYFYIDERDLVSKRTFILLTDFYQLTAGLAPESEKGMVLTLPVGAR